MSVLLETSLGDLVVDLLVDQAPKACENFLKLCKKKYYNYSPVHTIQPNFSFQTGDPLGPVSKESDGGSSIWGLLPGASISKKTFLPEFHPKLKHTERGTLSMATAPSTRDPDQREAGSQFIITLADSIDYLDGKAAVFGKVVEGFDVLEKINGAFIDHDGRPLKDIRIRHTIILDEADIPDPAGFEAPAESPIPSKAQLATVRIADDEEIAEEQDPAALEKIKREREAKAQALTLEMMGDLPFAEVAPPENVLFVCKLNPVTQDADLDLIFSRFGKIHSCEVIRDKHTGDSLQYAFIEFAEKESCERAYHKMEGVLIDDHRIHVDFSQSVSRLSDAWRGKRSAAASRRGGFGGFDNLEKRRHYRDEEDRPRPRDAYSYVRAGDDRPDARAHDQRRRGPRSRSRSRSRSPRRRARAYDGDGRGDRGSYERRQRDHGYERDRERRRHRDGGARDRDRDRGGGGGWR